MKIEVGHEGVESVGREIEGGRKKAEEDGIGDQGVGPGVELPKLAVGHPVPRGQEEEAPVGRDVETVGSLGLHGNFAHRDRAVENRARRSEADAVEQIFRLGTNVDVVVRARGLPGGCMTADSPRNRYRPRADGI